MSMMKTAAQATGLIDLRRRLLFVLLGLLVYRLGSYIPVPGIDPQRLADFFHAEGNSFFGLFNMFSGGAFSRMTIFALGIMPYISSSIIVQLLTAIIPSFADLKKEGQAGQRKLTQYTRLGTLVLSLFQSIGMAKFMVSQGFVIYNLPVFYLLAVMTLTTGTLFLMWLGEQMTERGIGNGISLLIFSSIVSGIPTALFHTFEQSRQGNISLLGLLLILAVIIAVTLFVVFVERAQRRITVNYPNRQQGRKMMAAQFSHLPLKINMAGVIPPIFASSILLFPQTISHWFATSPDMSWLATIGLAITWGQPLYIICYALLILFFCFFYTAIIFNPKDTAENLKKSGAFIPGIRPGEQTANYIDLVMSRLTLVGAIYISLVSILPMILMVHWDVPFYFGGTSLLIVVVVVMDFIAQVQSHLMSSRYDSLMKKSQTSGSGLLR